MALQNWKKHGLSIDAREQLRSHLLESVVDGEVPGGILLIIHKNDTVFREAFGYRHIRRQLPFELTTPFRAASISKSIIATLATKLEADGLLDLDFTIDEYLTEARHLRLKSSIPIQRTPTLRECLHHTAGFLADEQSGGRPWLTLKEKGLTLEEAVNVELKLPIENQPGRKFAYSGIGYDIVGRIIEIVTGDSLEETLQVRLCKPLGMHNTTYYPDADTANQMASFYWRWRSDGTLHRQLEHRRVKHGEYVSVGGGIVTTVDDLARFLQMHRNLGIAENHRWADPTDLLQQYRRVKPGSFYGLGFTLGPAGRSVDGPAKNIATWISHTGSSGTLFWLDRNTDTIGVIVTQHRNSLGTKMPESERRIPIDADSWQKNMKSEFIDPVFGWR